jgi:putative ABC transport system ATP-binding protein
VVGETRDAALAGSGTATSEVIRLEGVTKRYALRSGQVHALREVNLAIARGAFLAVTGLSGSGKTTLLLTIGGLIHPTEGRVLVEGEDLYRLGPRGIAAFRNRRIGFVLQSFHLIPYLDALENVMVPMVLHGRVNGDGETRARGLLERLGLGNRVGHLPRELSVGQQQRVAIARALANDPELILADEPTGNLDPTLSREILGVLRELNEREGRTVVMVTHSPDAARVGTHRLHLEDGRVVEGREADGSGRHDPAADGGAAEGCGA